MSKSLARLGRHQKYVAGVLPSWRGVKAFMKILAFVAILLIIMSRVVKISSIVSCQPVPRMLILYFYCMTHTHTLLLIFRISVGGTRCTKLMIRVAYPFSERY